MATRAKPKDILAKAGDVGLKISGGLVQEEYARGLLGEKAKDTWQEMLDSPLPGAVFSLISMIAGQVDWKVCAADESPEADAERQTMQDVIDGMRKPFSQIMREGLSAYPFGFYVGEILYRAPVDGRWSIEDIEPRAQSSVQQWIEERQEDGRYKITGFKQWVPSRGNYDVPLSKCLHFVPRPEKRSPEGKSAFRSGWRSWMYARNLEESESIGIDRDLTGIPDIQLPPSVMSPNADAASQSVRADWEDKGRKLRAGKLAALVRPSEEIDGKKTGYAVKLMTSGGTQRVVADVPIRRHEQRFLISVLSDFMTLGEQVGSRALGDPKIALVMLAIGGLLDMYADAFSEQVIGRLCDLNGVPEELRPYLERGEVQTPTLEELVGILSAAVTGGLVVPNQALQDWVMSQIPGAPEPDADTQDIASVIPSIGPDDTKATDTALNGAQVTAAQGIVASVAAGQLPRDTAVAMLTEFFNIDAARADRILGSVGRTFTPSADPRAETEPSASQPTPPGPPPSLPEPA